MADPLFNINDAVYLRSSAGVGYLESYIIDNIIKRGSKWLYHIFLSEFKPAAQTYSDKNIFASTSNLFFDESELVDYCDALVLARTSLDRRINLLSTTIDTIGCVAESVPTQRLVGKEPFNSNKFDIDDIVYLQSSAKIGFLEPYSIQRIFYDRAYHGWKYEIDLSKQATLISGVSRTFVPSRVMYFTEGELMTRCEALLSAKSALERQKDNIQGKIDAQGCDTDATG